MFINKPFSRRSGSCTPIFTSVASPKMSPIILLLLFASYFSNCNAYAAQAELEKTFNAAEIIPDVVSTTPKQLLHVEWPSSRVAAKLGNELTPTQVRTKPTVHFAADPYAYYTLIMTDPDAPSRKSPSRREWHHWLVVNIPGSKVDKGQTLTEYVGSATPKGTGLHRYVLLVYKQPFKLSFNERLISNRDGNRGNFSAKNFAYKYKLGDPVAGNFYVAQYDDSVPAAQKQLGLA